MADLEIDLLRQRVTRSGQRLDLTSKEFSLLTLLARRQREVLSRALIAKAVWDMNFLPGQAGGFGNGLEQAEELCAVELSSLLRGEQVIRAIG